MLTIFKNLLSIFSKNSSLLIYLLCFGIGVGVTSFYYDSEIKDIHSTYEKKIQEKILEKNEELLLREEESVKIIEERDRLQTKYNSALRNIDSLNYRMQHSTNKGSSSGSEQNGSNSTNGIGDELSRSRELLQRCGKLLVRGVELSGESSIKHNTMVEYYNKNKK